MGCQGSKDTTTNIEYLENLLREERAKNLKLKEELDQVIQDFDKLKNEIKFSDARRNGDTDGVESGYKTKEYNNLEHMLEHTLDEKARLENRLLKEQQERAQLEQKLRQHSN
jgi:hypothetical protein